MNHSPLTGAFTLRYVMYTTFNETPNDATLEPMFFGNSVNMSRYDKQKYPFLEKLIDTQLAFFWRPEEIDLSQDKTDFRKLGDHEVHMFVRNLGSQILMDSVQSRAITTALLDVTSLPELETWFQTWAFQETVHSRSYTHIIRNIFPNPSEIFDEILTIPEIQARAKPITGLYDHLINLIRVREVMGEGTAMIAHGREWDTTPMSTHTAIYKAMVSANILEGIRFYNSFTSPFTFGEQGKMEGNAKIMKFIARKQHCGLVH